MKIHFIGIGGIGVSALAKYYLNQGHKISGSDLVSSEITDVFKKSGARIFIGKHKEKNISKDVDLVIYSPAVPIDNPELKKARRLKVSGYKLHIQSYPQALGELTKKYFTIAVCGSHGKSTVAAMIGLILTKAGLNPTVILGTKLKEFGDSNFRMGGYPNYKLQTTNYKLQTTNYKLLMIEADEYKASFLNYWPKIIVLTTLEPDHLDYYKNFKNYLSAFKKFIFHLPKNGSLVANKDDKNVCHITCSMKHVTYFSLKQKDAKKLRRILKIPGEFNVSNALASLAVARILRIPDKISFKALSEYKGSWRRFEEKTVKLKTINYKLITDYGHHPTQVKVALEAAREKYPKRKIWCIFQPHQYQRTYYLFKDFVKVLKNVPIDKMIITDIYDVAGRENNAIKKRVNSQKLVKAVNKPFVMYLPKPKIVNFLKQNLKGSRLKRGEPRPKGAGEVVIIMGAGDIYNLFRKLRK